MYLNKYHFIALKVHSNHFHCSFSISISISHALRTTATSFGYSHYAIAKVFLRQFSINFFKSLMDATFLTLTFDLITGWTENPEV